MFVSSTVLRKNRNTDFLIYLIYNETFSSQKVLGGYHATSVWQCVTVCNSILLHANIHGKSSRP